MTIINAAHPITTTVPRSAPAAPRRYDPDGAMTPARLHSLWIERKNKNMKVLAAGEMIRRVYNGDWQTVLPELERSERAQVANLVLNGIEQHALRISSTMPNVYFPPERNSKAARDRAVRREMVLAGWHDSNKMRTRIFRKRSRYLVGYGSSPVYLRPGPNQIPVWETWDPLSTFPAPGDELVPADCIYHFKRSWGYLHDTFDVAARLPLNDGQTRDTMLDCLFFCSAHELLMIAVGGADNEGSVPAVQLQRVPNPTGRPCAVVPQRITLDRLQGQFDQMVGMYEAAGLLWSMHLEAIKRAIFTETWAVGRAGESPNVIATADPIRGDIGIIDSGDIKAFRADPSIQTLQAMDRLEQSERQTGAIPAELGGQSASNIRTGRRGQQILGSAIDYPIQEHQDILADSLYEENLAAIDIANTYWPNTERTLYVKFGDGAVTYTPSDLFTTSEHTVSYAYSGTDSSSLVIEGLQRVGAGTLSKRSFMGIDPMITDPDYELHQQQREALREALLASIQQQAQDPAGPYQPKDMARLMSLVADRNMELEDAVIKVQEELQKEQEAAAQGQMDPAAMQPGLSMPGAPGALPPAAPPEMGGTPDQAGLASLMGQLRSVQRGGGANTVPGSS